VPEGPLARHLLLASNSFVTLCTLRKVLAFRVMSPELPDREIRRVVRDRLRKGTLPIADTAIPSARAAAGTNACVVCGFTISADRNECAVLDGSAHEPCAVIWREESDRLS
jgi:hypothetical protein